MCRRGRGVGAQANMDTPMQVKRWESLCILLFSLPLVTAGQALRISVYTPAGTVNKYLSTPDDRAKAAAVIQRFKVSKIWIEGRRGDQYVTPELLTAARDDFRARGFAVSGGLTTVPGKTFGVQSNPGRTWMNFQAEQTQKEIVRFYQENAAIFDEIMVDDFYATEDTTPESESARGNLSWSEYRRRLLVGLIDSGHAEAGPCGKTFYARHHQIPAVVRGVPYPRLRPSGHGRGSQPDLGRHGDTQPAHEHVRLRRAHGGIRQLPVARFQRRRKRAAPGSIIWTAPRRTSWTRHIRVSWRARPS